MILLSDIDGLYTADPKKDKGAEFIPLVENLDDKIYSLAGGAGSALGTGGMSTKLKAAQICTDGGIDMIIANGANPEKLYEAVSGESIGTLFKGKK